MARSASCHAPIIAHCASIDSRIRRASRYVHAFLTPSHDPIMYCAINDRGHLTIRLLTRDVTASIGYHFETQKSYVKREREKKTGKSKIDNVVCYRRKTF